MENPERDQLSTTQYLQTGTEVSRLQAPLLVLGKQDLWLSVQEPFFFRRLLFSLRGPEGSLLIQYFIMCVSHRWLGVLG